MIEGYVRTLGRLFYVDGLDREDIEQEARLAAWLAPAGLERTAARRRVIDLIRTSTRIKRPRFADTVTLDDLAETVASREDVLDAVCRRETLREVLAATRSESEVEALGRVLRGEPIRRDEKRLGVALWRLRRRLDW